MGEKIFRVSSKDHYKSMELNGFAAVSEPGWVERGRNEQDAKRA